MSDQTARSSTDPDVEGCPTCHSPRPHLHPALHNEGEVQVCRDPFHTQRPPLLPPDRALGAVAWECRVCGWQILRQKIELSKALCLCGVGRGVWFLSIARVERRLVHVAHGKPAQVSAEYERLAGCPPPAFRVAVRDLLDRAQKVCGISDAVSDREAVDELWASLQPDAAKKEGNHA